MRRLAFAAAMILAGSLSLQAAAEEKTAEIVAVHVRDQGHPCAKAESAKPDPEASRPDEEAWILHCSNATYRVRLIPDMSAVIERLD